MRRILLILIATFSLLAGAQEIRRPLSEYNLGGCVAGCSVYDGQITFPNAYDGGGTSTSTSRTVSATIGGTEDHESNDGFTSWNPASGAYSNYYIEVDSQCLIVRAPATCGISYSTNSGSSWTALESGNWTHRTTSSISISGSVPLSQVRVRAFVVATDGATAGTTGSATLTIYDIWTSGNRIGRTGQVISNE